jgi:hypothetical protein
MQRLVRPLPSSYPVGTSGIKLASPDLLRLVFVAPEIVEAIAARNQQTELTAEPSRCDRLHLEARLGVCPIGVILGLSRA